MSKHNMGIAVCSQLPTAPHLDIYTITDY